MKKRFLIPLLAGLALPNAVNAEPIPKILTTNCYQQKEKDLSFCVLKKDIKKMEK